MELVETEVWVLHHIFNELVSYLAVTRPHSFIGIALQVALNLRVQLVDLLDGLVVKRLRIEHPAHEFLVGNVLNRVLGIVVFILEERIVPLAITAGHFNSADSCAISHVADHTRIDGLHEILSLPNSIIVEIIALVLIGGVLRDVNFRMKQDFEQIMLVVFDDIIERGMLDFRAPVGGQGRYLCVCCNTGLQKGFIASVSSSDNVAVVASDTAFAKEFVLRVLLILVYLCKLNCRVPFPLLELVWFLGALLGFRGLFGLGLSSSDFPLLHSLGRAFVIQSRVVIHILIFILSLIIVSIFL